MRQWIDIAGSAHVIPFDGIVYHCSEVKFSEFRVDPRRGIYFANDPDHAYGGFVYKCRVRLQHALVAGSTDNFEIDRETLLSEGYDGRIVDYDEEKSDDVEEMYDVIAFHAHQVEILEISDQNEIMHT